MPARSGGGPGPGGVQADHVATHNMMSLGQISARESRELIDTSLLMAVRRVHGGHGHIGLAGACGLLILQCNNNGNAQNRMLT